MRPPGQRLWQTYALSVAGLVTLVLTVSGLAQLWLIQRETRIAVEALQALEAARASARIERFIGQTGALLRAALALQDSRHLADADADIQFELYRLMKQSRAIQALYWIDQHGQERVYISRMEPDRIGVREDRSQSPEFLYASAEAPWFGPVTFVVNQPRVVLARRGSLPQSGVLAAEVELAQLREIIDETRFGREGQAYVVDGEGRLLAHPDFLRVLARPDWADHPPVRAAIRPAGADRGGLIEFRTPEGRAMVARAAPLSVPGWRLITEQPRDEAYAPIRRALATALLILVFAVLAGSAVGIVLARRVVRPIRELAEGADRIGEGQLDHRIALLRGDELGQLAARFNQMAERLGEACGVLFRHPQEKTLWLVGDTIWRDEIAADLLKLRPDVVVLNAGYAHVIGFGPIIMGKEDLLNVHFTLPEAKIMAIHLEAVNHCLVSREEMRQYALDNQIADVVSIPQDGETVVY